MAWVARLRRTWTDLVAEAQLLALDLTAAAQVTVT